MNRIFAEHVTSTAFFLTMSKKQMAVLTHIATNPWTPDGVDRDRSQPYVGYYAMIERGWGGFPRDVHISTARSLEAKGLLEHAESKPLMFSGAREPRPFPYWRVTRAGELVVELLIEAGLVAQVAPARKRKAA